MNKKPPYYIEIPETKSYGNWWRIKARNGQILATSETYFGKRDCKRVAVRFARATGLEVKELCP